MSQLSLTCCVALGRALTLSGPHLPQMQNEGIGQDDLSEATFNPDFLSVVNSLGTVRPVSSSQLYQEMLMSSRPPLFPLRSSSEGEGGGVSEKEMCYADGQSLEKT